MVCESQLRDLKVSGAVSLLDMLNFCADDYCRASSLLGQIFAQIKSGIEPTMESWNRVAGSLGKLERECERLGLSNTLAQIRRIKPIFVEGSSAVNWNDLGRDVIEVQLRMNDELEACTLFLLTHEEANFYSDHHFPISVVDYFQESIFDMEEAGKCRAVERPTACVFHLMRVTEHGIQAVAKLIGITDPRPNWEPIILKIDSELKQPYEKRQFKGSGDLLASISTHFHTVKIAWRNRVMHIEKKYTGEEAREIYAATVGLMRYLAENLPSRTS